MSALMLEVAGFQEHIDSVLDNVAKEHVLYVLTRDDRPEAALIPHEDFLRFQALREQEMAARPVLKELLLGETARAEIPVPARHD